jgi:hypothetical protein
MTELSLGFDFGRVVVLRMTSKVIKFRVLSMIKKFFEKTMFNSQHEGYLFIQILIPRHRPQ